MKIKIGKYKVNRKIDIHIDNYDVWNLDNTLALIIAPALIKLKEIKHGNGHVDNEDVPEELHRPEGLKAFDVDDNWEARFDYILDELIWTFTTLSEDDVNDVKYKLETRVNNGLRLFGKYYRGLWD